MSSVEKLISNFNALNETHRAEVIDFIEFLKQKENKRIEEVANEMFSTYDKVFKKLSRTYFSKSNITLEGSVKIYHSSIIENNYLEMIVVYFEKGDCYAEFLLPNRVWLKIEKFNNEELVKLREYAVNNEPLIWETARRGRGGE